MGFSNNSRSQPAMTTMTSVTMTSTMTPPSRRDVITISHTCVVCGLSAVRRTDFIILYFIFWRSHRIYWYCICCCCNFNSHLLAVIMRSMLPLRCTFVRRILYELICDCILFYFRIISSCDMHLSLSVINSMNIRTAIFSSSTVQQRRHRL